MADGSNEIIPEPRKRGRPKGFGLRPTIYDSALAFEICQRIATTARGIDFICNSDPEMPSARTVHKWLNEVPEFEQSYLHARGRQADLIFDECLEIADDCSRDLAMIGDDEGREVVRTDVIQRAKLRVDTRMRMAGKLAPKKYGDRIELQHREDDRKPLLDLGKLTPEQRDRLKEFLQQLVQPAIEGEARVKE